MADYGAEYSDAMGALKQMIAQQQLAAQQKPTGIFGNVDPVMLGLARGFLSPTRTGGFGESIGTALAGAEGPLAALKKQQFDAQNKIQELQLARAKLAMEAPYYSARAQHYLDLGAGGEDSTNVRRNLLKSQIESLANAKPGVTLNPSTGKVFANDQEIEDFGASLTSEFLSLEAKGQKSKTPPKDDKSAKSNYSSDDGEKPAEKPVDKKSSPKPPAEFPNAQIGKDGKYYIPDPKRPGKFLRVD